MIGAAAIVAAGRKRSFPSCHVFVTAWKTGILSRLGRRTFATA